MLFTYIVRCTCKDEALAEEWMSWMRDEHLAEVCEAGAMDGEVIRLESGPGTNTTTCEVHYHFASRSAFNAYQRDHAPRLRAEGLRRFPTERGVSYQRSVGEVVARREAAAPPGRMVAASQVEGESTEGQAAEEAGGATVSRKKKKASSRGTVRRSSSTKKK